MTEQELLTDCLRRLNQTGISYMLVGSMASNFWGIPRSTHDIDFVVQYDANDVATLVTSFDDDFFIQETSVRSALSPPFQFNALDNRSALKVDFFRLTDDAYETERFGRRHSITLFGEPAAIAAAEDVILHKLRWYSISPSDRQLTDSAGIMSVNGDMLDRDYMRHWAQNIGVSGLLRRVERGDFPPKTS